MMSELNDCTDAFVRTLEELAAEDQRVIVVTDDSLGSGKLAGFRNRFPDRLVRVRSAEQEIVATVLALAKDGGLPFVCTDSSPALGALQQLQADLSSSRLSIKICGVSRNSGCGTPDAPPKTLPHRSLKNAIGDLCVIVPADPFETEQAVRTIAAYDGPVFLSLTRMPTPVVHPSGYRFRIGRAAIVHQGTDLTLISSGGMVSWTVSAAEALAGDGIGARVVNMSTIRPLDTATVERAARETGGIITVEEFSVFGRLGGAVAQVIQDKYRVPVRLLDVPGALAPTGAAPWLFDYFGMTVSAIRNAALELLQARRKRKT